MDSLREKLIRATLANCTHPELDPPVCKDATMRAHLMRIHRSLNALSMILKLKPPESSSTALEISETLDTCRESLEKAAQYRPTVIHFRPAIEIQEYVEGLLGALIKITEMQTRLPRVEKSSPALESEPSI